MHHRTYHRLSKRIGIANVDVGETVLAASADAVREAFTLLNDDTDSDNDDDTNHGGHVHGDNSFTKFMRECLIQTWRREFSMGGLRMPMNLSMAPYGPDVARLSLWVRGVFIQQSRMQCPISIRVLPT